VAAAPAAALAVVDVAVDVELEPELCKVVSLVLPVDLAAVVDGHCAGVTIQLLQGCGIIVCDPECTVNEGLEGQDINYRACRDVRTSVRMYAIRTYVSPATLARHYTTGSLVCPEDQTTH
jgi:hypothetical protein